MDFWSQLIGESFDACVTCLKWPKLRSEAKFERATNLLEIIHVDVCGPIFVAACGGFFYFINFHRWFKWIYWYIYLMRKKYEIFEMVQRISAWSKNHCNKKIKYLWLDHRGEHLSYKFSKHLKSCRICSTTYASRNTIGSMECSRDIIEPCWTG